MNRPFTRWFILIIFMVIVIVAISIPVLTNSSQYQTMPVPASGLASSAPGDSTEATSSPTAPRDNTQVFVDPGSDKPTPSPTPLNNCTYSPTYWVSHSDAWPSQFVVGSYRYSKTEALNYLQESQVDISTLLFLYVNTAYLNIINGADPSTVEAAVLNASDWLNKHPPGSQVLGPEAQPAVQLTIRLFEFNMGTSGPGRCPDDAAQMTQALGIQAPVLLITPSNIILTSIAPSAGELTPTATASATPSAVQPTDYIPLPTSTRKPSRGGPSPTQAPPPTPRPSQAMPTAPPTREPLPTPPPP